MHVVKYRQQNLHLVNYKFYLKEIGLLSIGKEWLLQKKLKKNNRYIIIIFDFVTMTNIKWKM